MFIFNTYDQTWLGWYAKENNKVYGIVEAQNLR